MKEENVFLDPNSLHKLNKIRKKKNKEEREKLQKVNNQQISELEQKNKEEREKIKIENDQQMSELELKNKEEREKLQKANDQKISELELKNKEEREKLQKASDQQISELEQKNKEEREKLQKVSDQKISELEKVTNVEIIKKNNLYKLKNIYSRLFMNAYFIHPDKQTQLYIDRDYILIGDNGINWYTPLVTLNNTFDIHLNREFLNLNSRYRQTKIISFSDKNFWTSKDALKLAMNMASYQLNPEYGLWKGRTGFDNEQPLTDDWKNIYPKLNKDTYWNKELGAWPLVEYTNSWIKKSNDIYCTKRGEVFLYKDAEYEYNVKKNSNYKHISKRVFGENVKEWYGSFKDGGTTCFMRFIALTIKHTKNDFLIKVFRNGLEYFYNHPDCKIFYEPSSPGVSLFFNDGAFPNLLMLLLDISQNRNNVYDFLTIEEREKCSKILDNGIDLLLKLQIDDVITNKKTGWTQVYNTNLEPTSGRSFEPYSICIESVGSLNVLMDYNKINKKIIISVSNYINYLIQNALYDNTYHYNDLFGLVPQKCENAEPVWGRFYDIWSLDDHQLFLKSLEEFKNEENTEKKLKLILEKFKAKDSENLYRKNYEQLKNHYERYINKDGNTIPIFGDIDGGIESKLENLTYERRKGYTWILKIPIYYIEKYLDWIVSKLFKIENPEKELLESIIEAVESFIKLREKSKYKYYSDEDYNKFIEKYKEWCNSVGVKPTFFFLNKIKVGLIGLGNRMNGMIHGLINNNDVNIISICDISQSRIDIFKNNYDKNNNMNVYKDYNNMLDKEDLDAVVISLIHHNNGFVTDKCIDKGIKYIYEEKPFFWNLKEGYELVNKIQNKNVNNQIGSQLHSNNILMNGVRLIRNNGIGVINNIDFLIPWYPSKKYFNKENEKIENNNLTHDLFNNWLYPNNNYISNNSDNFKNLLIKNNNELLKGNWRDTIEYGGGLATAIGFHWWGYLFKCLNINYNDYPKFNFIPPESDKYLVKIEIDCPRKLKKKIIINYGFVKDNQDQEMKFYGSNGKWMKFNYIKQITTNVDMEKIILNDQTLDYKFYYEFINESTWKDDTHCHFDNWVQSIKLGIKPNFPVNEAFYPNSICLIINAIYNIDFKNNILWNTKDNIFDTNNNKFKELINWEMFDKPKSKINKIIIENKNNFNVDSLGNCIFNNENYFLTFGILENDNKNIYLAKSTDKNKWNNSKIIDNGINPFTIEFNNKYYIYYLGDNNKLSCYNTNDFENLDKIENINFLNNDFITNSFVIINFHSKLYILYKDNLNNIKCAKSDDGINWLESDIIINNDEIKYLSDIKYYNNVYYLSCVCLSTNELRVNDNQFSIKIFYSYDLENWDDLLNQELILDNFEIDDKVIISNPYNSIDPESSNDIIYKYGCKFFSDSNDITSNLLLCSSDGIIARY